MRTKKPWLTLLALLAALSLIAASCSDDDGDDTATGDADTETTAEDSSDSTMADDGTESTMADDGTETTMADDGGEVAEPVGEACSAIPADGEGSSAGMADDTAGTAASNNPVLSTLVEAVTAAGLVDALNDPSAEYTIFAPYNDAFAEIPEADLTALLGDTEALTDVLTYHVYADGKMSAEDLAGETELTMLNGDTVEIAAEGDTIMVNGEAMVICGNVTTANATVHIIDKVLMPPA